MHINPVRYHSQRCLHFITFSCYQRMKRLNSVAARETFEHELERVRVWYGCMYVIDCISQRGTIGKYSNREGYDFESYRSRLGQRLGFSH